MNNQPSEIGFNMMFLLPKNEYLLCKASNCKQNMTYRYVYSLSGIIQLSLSFFLKALPSRVMDKAIMPITIKIPTKP